MNLRLPQLVTVLLAVAEIRDVDGFVDELRVMFVEADAVDFDENLAVDIVDNSLPDNARGFQDLSNLVVFVERRRLNGGKEFRNKMI
tara:strand:+ start:2264 stop:2524 length:261 start_codon:yes stop_codon:yes gene_type:complete